MVYFQQAKKPLNDLHARPDAGGLQGDVRDAIDLDARRDLYPE
jgi:hypothetical protein